MKRFNIAGTCRPDEHYMVDIIVSFCFNKGKTPGMLPPVERDGCTLVEVVV